MDPLLVELIIVQVGLTRQKLEARGADESHDAAGARAHRTIAGDQSLEIDIDLVRDFSAVTRSGKAFCVRHLRPFHAARVR